MQASLRLRPDPAAQYVLRLGDTCLILGQRVAEWCGQAPILEEDIALANVGLDLIGQARGLLTHAGVLESRGQARVVDEDQLAFLRDERDYLNVTMVELPRGDFAFTVVRNTLMATWFKLIWERLAGSADAVVAGIAAKAVKEARYHQQHSADWLVRLGDGTGESHRRATSALATLWPYTAELFDADPVDEAAVATGLGPCWADLREPWHAEVRDVLQEATLAVPRACAFRSSGRRGVHGEHLGPLLAVMQHLQRSHPGGAW